MLPSPWTGMVALAMAGRGRAARVKGPTRGPADGPKIRRIFGPSDLRSLWFFMHGPGAPFHPPVPRSATGKRIRGTPQAPCAEMEAARPAQGCDA